MEDAGFGGLRTARWSRKKIRGVAKSVCAEFGVPPPTIRFVKMKYSGDCGGGLIRLSTENSRGSSPLVVLHELAHHILDCWVPLDPFEPHGPEFAGVLNDLLSVAGVVPYEGYRDMARKYGVAVLDTKKYTTPRQLYRAVLDRSRRMSV